MDTFHELADLVAGVLMPRGCAGCSMPDEVLCPQCAALFSGVHRRALPGAEMSWAYSCAQYTPRVRHAILGWKDHGDCECDGAFAAALAGLSVSIRLTDALDGRPLLAVPAPSTRRSVRRRGRWHMRSLACQYVSLLRRQGVDARLGTVLAMPGVRGKAVERGSRGERGGRVGGGMVVTHPESLCGVGVVVLDDIVTTGATMRSCVRALLGAGADVVTALALAQVEADRSPDVEPDRCIVAHADR